MAQRFWRGYCSFSSAAFPVLANVYATDIQINGSTNTAVIVPGESLAIGYILNYAATAGVWVRIYSGSNAGENLASRRRRTGNGKGNQLAGLGREKRTAAPTRPRRLWRRHYRRGHGLWRVDEHHR